jgi:hypothetical protein
MQFKLNLVESLENTDGRFLLALKTLLLLMPFVVKIIPLFRPVVGRVRRVALRRASARRLHQCVRSDKQ